MAQDWYDFSEGDRVVYFDDPNGNVVWTITRVWTTGKVEMRSGQNGATMQTHARNLLYA